MLAVNDHGTYAGKKRKKPLQKIKPRPENAKTNPSKRHRDRLNGELDKLTSLLPFSEDVRSRLDKLSVLRLSVAFIKAKNFFHLTMKNNSLPCPTGNGCYASGATPTSFSEGDLLLQALNGVVLVVTCEGYVFYVSPSIQDHLGFHQSDVLHQSVFELIHTEDRALFRSQLHFALNPQSLNQDQGAMDPQSSDTTQNIMTYDPQHIPPENSSFLERSFVCRMRCLLDNSSGFLALSFQGRLKYLYGQGAVNGTGPSQPQLALFAVARPVQPPSILEIRSKTVIFHSKHRLDFGPLGLDSRGEVVLGYTEFEFNRIESGYQFVHAADMMHCADNHVRMMKTGETGATIFRLLSKEKGWLWVQSNGRLIYKDGRPDFIIARERVLSNEEGEEHLRKRRLQLPFNITTGEAVLYENTPVLDAPKPCGQTKAPKIANVFKDNNVHPNSLLGCFYRQSQAAYMQSESEAQISLEKVFMESRALVNVPCDSSWKSEQLAGETVDSMLESVLETIEQMASEEVQQGQGVVGRVDQSDLKDWENALLRLGQTPSNGGGDGTPSLDDILTEDVLAYLEETLLKDSLAPHAHALPIVPPQSCMAPGGGGGVQFEMGQKTLNHSSSCVNGVTTATGMSLRFTPPRVGADKDPQVPGNQRQMAQLNLQLDDLFPPSLGVADLKDSVVFPHNGLATSWESSSPWAGPGKGVGQVVKSKGWSLSPQNHQALPSCKVNQVNHQDLSQCQPPFAMSVPGTVPHNFNEPSNIPLERKMNAAPVDPQNPSALSSPGTNFSNQQVNHRNACGLNTHHHNGGDNPSNASQPFQGTAGLWQQIGQQNVSLNGFPVDCPSQVPLKAGQWAPNNNQNCQGQSQSQSQSHFNFVKEKFQPKPPGGLLANDSQQPLSSCMFSTARGQSSAACLSQGLSHTVPEGTGSSSVPPLSWEAVPHNHSPPQGSCYFQWNTNKPVVGTATIPQDNACISPSACQGITPETPASDAILQQYLNCNGQTQIQRLPTANGEPAAMPPLVNGALPFPETTPMHCYNY
ncbi:aryl hydrocarbon receptor-like [Engraulis encrasicolus]|uniref:aryl hydrocarbon receptor-like n=1 Tax=Engraulis encrasicolus TaxID=184585 RepID=UPI002FCF7094